MPQCALAVEVKWTKNTYQVDVDTTLPPSALKAQLFSLTGVAPERQKIMVKGGLLKDDQVCQRPGMVTGRPADNLR